MIVACRRRGWSPARPPGSLTLSGRNPARRARVEVGAAGQASRVRRIHKWSALAGQPAVTRRYGDRREPARPQRHRRTDGELREAKSRVSSSNSDTDPRQCDIDQKQPATFGKAKNVHESRRIILLSRYNRSRLCSRWMAR